MPSKNRKPLKIYLTAEEKEKVAKISGKANLSLSEFGKICVLGRKLPDSERQKDILDLVKVNADLARLGNLLKMFMDDEEILSLISTGKHDLDALIHEIRINQTTIQELVHGLRDGSN